MAALIDVILPVFLILAFGYIAVWKNLLSDSAVQGLMQFTQTFAIPFLLFRALSTIDLSQTFNAPLLASFYLGAIVGFAGGLLGARYLFGRDWEDSVAVGFCGMFSNTVLLGLPITERAYGATALEANYAIIALHAPFGFAVGITIMEVVLNRGAGLAVLPAKVFKAMATNSLIIGISLGLLVNLSGLAVPTVLGEALDLVARAALPAALFGLGGLLVQYRPDGDLRLALFVVGLSLILHPLIAYTMGGMFGLTVAELRSATLTAAMAPGINVYIFANIYGRAKRVAASSVLLATGLSVLTVWGWLAVLP